MLYQGFQKFFLKLAIILMAMTIASATSYASNDTSLRNTLQSMLETTINEDVRTPGVVLLITSPDLGTITLAAGYSNLRTLTPMNIHNNFRIGSITKTFVAVTILKLVHQDMLQLSEKVDKLLPPMIPLNRIANIHQITLQDLLDMRSGIPNYVEYDEFWDSVRDNTTHPWQAQEILATMYDKPPNFAPNKGYEYSNTNYILLQLIIERATGTKYATQIHKYILTPLSLNHTYVEGDDSPAAQANPLMTHGYYAKRGILHDVTNVNDGLGLGDSGMVTTAEDLAAFVKALLEYKTVLSPPSLGQMLTLRGEQDEQYGLGIYQEKVAGETAWTHNGSSSGFLTQYYYFPERKLTMIVLTNSVSSECLHTIAERAMEIMQQQRKTVPLKTPQNPQKLIKNDLGLEKALP